MTTVTERRIVREATASGSAPATAADAAPAQPPGILKGSKIRCEGCDAAMAAGGQGSMLEGPAGENGDSRASRRGARLSDVFGAWVRELCGSRLPSEGVALVPRRLRPSTRPSEVRRTVRFSESTVLPPDSPLLPPPPEMITPPPIPTPDSATSDDGGGAGGGVTKFFPSSPPPVPATIPPPPDEELALEAEADEHAFAAPDAGRLGAKPSAARQLFGDNYRNGELPATTVLRQFEEAKRAKLSQYYSELQQQQQRFHNHNHNHNHHSAGDGRYEPGSRGVHPSRRAHGSSHGASEESLVERIRRLTCDLDGEESEPPASKDAATDTAEMDELDELEEVSAGRVMPPRASPPGAEARHTPPPPDVPAVPAAPAAPSTKAVPPHPITNGEYCPLYCLSKLPSPLAPVDWNRHECQPMAWPAVPGPGQWARYGGGAGRSGGEGERGVDNRVVVDL
ncbi:uncharacterized protein C6orf132-like [Schistocerca piceifrons]|uniref:uncharacterized protein C6orf132-like n=1 Tax=Schistocerca piceifrons TaxID=274613 RepID=UPI001F5EB59C|nr:uncharacterized protein C6orf132-like [Schistocerca piceifrons]